MAKSRTARGNSALVLICIVLAFYGYLAAVPAGNKPAGRANVRAKERVILRGRVAAIPRRPAPGALEIAVEMLSMPARGADAVVETRLLRLADLPWSLAAAIEAGDEITAEVSAARPAAGRAVRATIIHRRPSPRRAEPRGLDRQSWIYELFRHTSRDRALTIVLAAVLSEMALLSETTKEVFRNTGTTHILVVSGYHLSFIFGVLYFTFYNLLVRCPFLLLRIPIYIPASLLAFAGVGGYCLLVGGSIPAVRALFAAALFVSGRLIGRRSASIRSLLLAAGAVLWVYPGALGNPSFQLSFLALLGLYTAAQFSKRSEPPDIRLPSEGAPKERNFASLARAVWQRTLRQFQLALYICIGAWLFTMPAVVIWFEQVVPMAPLINVVSVPIFSFLCIAAGGLCLLAVYLELPGAWEVFECVLRAVDALFAALAAASDLCEAAGIGVWLLSPFAARVVAAAAALLSAACLIFAGATKKCK